VTPHHEYIASLDIVEVSERAYGPVMTSSNVRRIRRLRWLAAVAVAALLAVVTVVCVRDRPIPAAPPHAFVAPDLHGLPGLRVCWVEYARNEVSGQFATAGWTQTSTWNITVSGLLIRHPDGDLVLDVGNSSHFLEEVQDYPLLSRLWLEQLPGSSRRVQLAPDALRAAGVDPQRLRWVLLSHSHVDHAGGLVDLPGAPVLLASEELAFIRQHARDRSIQVIPAHARAVEGRATALSFTARPYETFDESADVFGDGSVVAVKLPGHTPGSIGVFVNVSPGLRLFHVGDAVNVNEATERRLTKSFVMASTDVDRDRADRVVAQLAQLHALDPGLTILPAHDRNAWQRVLGEAGHCIAP
jgi:glyoxylase-like metal-dependent hydrolase (beta-lactamase superfamily II)